MNKDKAKKSKVSPLVGAGLGTVAGGPVGAVAGASIARGVNKERDRYAKKGARSHLGKVGHDAKLGAKSLGLGSALAGGLAGAALGSTIPVVKKKGFLGLGRDKKAENQQRLKNTLSGAGLGALGYGTSGAIKGAGTGALVGATRGFVQENKTKNKKMKNYNYTVENFADFASRWKKTLSPDSVARGKATGQLLAQNRKDVKGGIYSQVQADKDLAEGIRKGKEASAAGKSALLKKAASSNRTMRPTTVRKNIKVARPSNKLSPQSAQSFKQGAQNQATNANNARLRGAAKDFKDNVGFRNTLEDTMNPKPKSPNTGYQKPPKVPKSSGGFNGKGLGDDAFKGFAGNTTKKVGRSMLGKKLLVGAGLAGGLYAAKKLGEKRRQAKQNPGLLSKLTKGRVTIK